MAAALDLDYKEPDWAGPPPDPTLVEIIKSGQILQQLVLKGKQFFVIGRLPVCDIELEHAVSFLPSPFISICMYEL